MIILGLSGGPNLVYENLFGLTPYQAHDSACVLVEDGEVLFAIEEERLNRIKHTNKFPSQAMRFCLDSRGIGIEDVDLIAYYSCEEIVDLSTKKMFLSSAQAPVLFNSASLIQHLIAREFGVVVEASKLRFVHHHYAHAMSAYAMSGFEKALIISIDGQGDQSSGMALVGESTRLEQLANFTVENSLGHFYTQTIAFLGYKIFDEYKVMGLAPYGNPKTYRSAFRSFYQLHADGEYEIDREKLLHLFELFTPRRKWEPFTQVHKDIAAALQESLEEIAFHIIKHYQQATGQRHLCLVGGVAHNCTLNGKVLDAGLFDGVFVQPAAHDAGGALGAALCAYYQARPDAKKPGELKQVYWGTESGPAESVLNGLTPWHDFISFEKVDSQIDQRAAELLAGGSVLGWVQGRSEFGPRALGNRSILADPRPAENKERINQMVKKREGYRPFAPSVLEEYVDEYFVVPENQKQLPFMVFVVKVKEDKRALLGAITHVDGTARVQTVARETNAAFWSVIHEFHNITGIPMLLNTSFNNHAEPIVDSIEDAVVCFLTTQLDYLVAGDYLVKKKDIALLNYLSLKPSLPAYISLSQVRRVGPGGGPVTLLAMENSYDPEFRHALPAETFRLLTLANGKKTLRELFSEMGSRADEPGMREMVNEILDLWSRRLIILRP
jgi:carbamoyltransferase